jgi:hypothetical protein
MRFIRVPKRQKKNSQSTCHSNTSRDVCQIKCDEFSISRSNKNEADLIKQEDYSNDNDSLVRDIFNYENQTIFNYLERI